ncbi:hypothetical protein FHR24_002147 [Wenyingzhuangia heitensis]|uniref:Flagellin biosynthesis protein FlgD n=1 Tax=Wenyingzhuangia heitensis TaxID=1487859 RepID=A0ABX0UA27_9FLAO|nr:DUF2271 domain-containing protein [Wenyingzhuangia heitensis]NIJ45679.1 hypothetical protein [Wenyingzhuangia heitensis]
MKINKNTLFFALITLSLSLIGFAPNPTNKYKCLIQMQDYTGEGAYVIVSLLKPDGSYDKTLYVNGNDDDWFFDIDAWWSYYGKHRPNIDAITGATLSGGTRGMSMLEIETDKLNKGYKIRFETAVEDQEYYKDDVEFILNDSIYNQKISGKGFINYIRLIPN